MKTGYTKYTPEMFAKTISNSMQVVLLNGAYNEGSASIIRRAGNRTREALVRRGLVHSDNRWTALGREVAIALGWRVKSVDELHALALTEDTERRDAHGFSVR